MTIFYITDASRYCCFLHSIFINMIKWVRNSLQVMRKFGVPEPYEKLKAFTRGNTIGKEDLQQFIGSLDIPSDVKHELLQLTPETYIGLAAELAKSV